MSDTKAALVWLKQVQGLVLDEAELVEPLATAARFSAAVAKAAEALPPGAEPAGFGPLLLGLAPTAGDDD